MALTKVTGQVVKTDTDLTVGVITAVTATFTGNVSVAGTLTYDDVTNVDSVGLITARSGIDITGGGGLNLTGGAGIITATRYRVGTAATLDASGLSVSAGVVTTTTLRIGAGSTAAPSITPTGDTDTGIFFPSADTIAFGEGGSEAARIDSSGRVGIGSTAPSGRLDVETASDTYVNFSTTNNGSAAGICLLGNNNNEFFGYANALRFATVTGKNAAGFNERMRMDSSGRLLVGTSSATANGGILELTSGITFPATAVAASNANTLDDYEEGTWTPAYSASGATFSYGGETAGWYTKVGRVVHLGLTLSTQTRSGGSGNLSITGLPFTSSSTAQTPQAGAIGTVNQWAHTSTYTQWGIRVDIGATTISIWEFGTSGGQINDTHAGPSILPAGTVTNSTLFVSYIVA